MTISIVEATTGIVTFIIRKYTTYKSEREIWNTNTKTNLSESKRRKTTTLFWAGIMKTGDNYASCSRRTHKRERSRNYPFLSCDNNYCRCLCCRASAEAGWRPGDEGGLQQVKWTSREGSDALMPSLKNWFLLEEIDHKMEARKSWRDLWLFIYQFTETIISRNRGPPFST